MFAQLSEDLLSKDAGLGAQVGEFLLVALVLSLPNRFVRELAVEDAPVTGE